MDTASRLAGSGQTILYFGASNGSITPIVWAQGFQETTPELLGQHQFIQPMDWAVPSEIMTSLAMSGGTFDVNLIETWSEHAWNRLGDAFAPFSGVARGGEGSRCDNILDIVRAISRSEDSLFLTKVIATPATSSERLGGAGVKRRATLYMNLKIIRVQDGDPQVEAATQQLTKTVTFAYTHRLEDYKDATPIDFPQAGRPRGVPASSAQALRARPALGNVI